MFIQKISPVYGISNIRCNAQPLCNYRQTFFIGVRVRKHFRIKTNHLKPSEMTGNPAHRFWECKTEMVVKEKVLSSLPPNNIVIAGGRPAVADSNSGDSIDNLKAAMKLKRNFPSESVLPAPTGDTLPMTPLSQPYTPRRRMPVPITADDSTVAEDSKEVFGTVPYFPDDLMALRHSSPR
ncbi:hypothetical protein FGIG_10258 [Fasciola gigantica]|uniref:Uncharacterized protein n=1 Tax=Fasciola gigantica TaxID=46835 RepID=A0A504YUF1_FASGI|nr:hypothetical protein FGIG_10258 [Fasciola gigantica]